MDNLGNIYTCLQKGKANEIKSFIKDAIDEGLSASEILDKGLLGAMDEVGKKFKNNEVFVPEVLIAARAMNSGLEELKPYLQSSNIKEKGTVILGTVKGDLHDIGKNIVKIMMEGKGIKVIDLGVDVDATTFIEAAKENNAKVICCSSLLTTTMNQMKEVVKLVDESNLHDEINIMIGGAPVTEDFCISIGADKYTPDATSAAEQALNFLN